MESQDTDTNIPPKEPEDTNIQENTEQQSPTENESANVILSPLISSETLQDDDNKNISIVEKIDESMQQPTIVDSPLQYTSETPKIESVVSNTLSESTSSVEDEDQTRLDDSETESDRSESGEEIEGDTTISITVPDDSQQENTSTCTTSTPHAGPIEDDDKEDSPLKNTGWKSYLLK
jgi:hypothetical protein